MNWGKENEKQQRFNQKKKSKNKCFIEKTVEQYEIDRIIEWKELSSIMIIQ